MVKKKEKRIEKCMICFLPINIDKDSYVHLIDYKLGKFYIEGYYHNKCWNEKIDVAKQLKLRTFGLLDKVEGLLGFKKEEVYEIKR